MKTYEIKFSVWEDGRGWQCHDIADREADTMEEAEDVALEMIAVCDGIQVIADIKNTKTGEIKTVGW
jgi:hypothetical protein